MPSLQTPSCLADGCVIPLTSIFAVGAQRLEALEADFILTDGRAVARHGLDAIEAVLHLKPSPFEGRRFCFTKGV